MVGGLALRAFSEYAAGLDRDNFAPPDVVELGLGRKGATQSLTAEVADRRLTVVIPAFNEEGRLPPVLRELVAYLAKRRARDPAHTFEVIVVDDGSTDGTIAAVKAFNREAKGTDGAGLVRILAVQRNRGKGYAVRMGYLHARGDWILFMDADGATDIKEIAKVEEEMQGLLAGYSEEEEAAMLAGKRWVQAQVTGGASLPGAVFGSRAHMQSEAVAQRKWYRNILMYGFHLLCVLVVGNQIRDTQCGFKLYTKTGAALVFPNQRMQRFCFDLELIYATRRFKIPMREVGVNWEEKDGSKVKPTTIMHMAFEILVLLMCYRITGVWAVQDQTF